MHEVLPKMLVLTRFGLGVKDKAWFEHRLLLVEAITAPSLAAQTSQDFIWAVFVDPDLDAGVRRRLEKILSIVPGATIIDKRRHAASDVPKILAEHGLIDPMGRSLMARLDDDDAWRTDTVERVRVLAGAESHGSAGIVVTFPNGLEWVMSDVKDLDKDHRPIRKQAIRPYTLPFHSLSIFVFGKAAEGVTPLAAKHSMIAQALEPKGIRSIVVDETEPMWVYARHKQALSSLVKAKSEPNHMALADLKAFGLDIVLVEKYLEVEREHGFLLRKRADGQRRIIERALKAGGLSVEERQHYENELLELSTNLIGQA